MGVKPKKCAVILKFEMKLKINGHKLIFVSIVSMMRDDHEIFIVNKRFYLKTYLWCAKC